MRGGEIQRGAERHDAGRIDVAMAAVIMPWPSREVEAVRYAQAQLAELRVGTVLDGSRADGD